MTEIQAIYFFIVLLSFRLVYDFINSFLDEVKAFLLRPPRALENNEIGLYLEARKLILIVSTFVIFNSKNIPINQQTTRGSLLYANFVLC